MSAATMPYFDIDVFALPNKTVPMQMTHQQVASALGLMIDQGPVGSPTGRSSGCRSRHPSTGSSSTCSSGYSSSGRPSPPVPTSLISDGPTVHRRLDRSCSEPAERSRDKQQQQQVNTGRYKTELCRPFEENGYCKYSDKCQFAHGMQELRSLNRHPKYKTELCRTFHTVGFCPYGPRCHFIHSEDEERLTQINSMKQQQAIVQLQQQQQQVSQAPQMSQQQPQQQNLNLSQQQQQTSLPTRAASHPTPMPQRPSRANFTLNLPPMVRDYLGSTADSPPASITDSPTMSPTSFEEFLTTPPPNLALCSPPASAPPCVQAFTFPDLSGPAPPGLSNVATMDAIQSLAAGLEAARISANARSGVPPPSARPDPMQDSWNTFDLPPSPPESLNGDCNPMNTCDTPLDVSRGLRLPIFSALVTKE